MPKAANRITIGAVPWASGLTNQGGQSTSPENSLWEAKNAAMDASGRLFKRPGFRLWGQSLDVQPGGDLQYTEVFDDLDSFSYAAAGTANDVQSGLEGNNFVLTTNEANDGTSSHTYNRAVQPSDGAVSDNNECTVNFMLRAMTAMPAQSTTTSADNGFAIHVRSDHAFICTLVWLSTGLFYNNAGTFELTGSETDIDDGAWHKVQVKITDATTGAVTITIDDDTTNAVSITATTYTDVSVAANQVAISATTNDDAVYSAMVNLVQYTDGTSMSAAKIKVLKDWSSANPDGQHLITVTEDLIWEDRHHAGRFTALDRAPSGDVILVPWLSELLICGSNDVMRRWNGDDKPILAPEEAPSDIIAATAHQGRLFAVRDDDPLTVRYSGSNDLSRWVDVGPQGFVGESSFPIPDARGRRITAMRGDFYGLLIIWTESSTWIFRTSGFPLIDGVLAQASANVGCVGPRAHDAIGRDVFFLNKDGVYNLSTVQEYGDVSSASITTNLRALWQHDNQIDQRKIVTNKNSCVVHAPSESKTYVSVQRTGNVDVNSIYVFNHDTGQWTGPYEFDSTLTAANGGGMRCIDYVQVGSQGRQFLFAASSLGDVAYMGNDRKTDYNLTIDGDGYPIEFKLRSARLDGRSTDPSLVRRMKRWRGMWIYILPRGSDKIKVTWNIDGNISSEDVTALLNPYDEPILDNTFTLGESSLGDPERIGRVWVPLDERGQWLEFIITIEDDTSADSKDIAIVGFEIDATIGDEEKDN
jgi:hypothetical protein